LPRSSVETYTERPLSGVKYIVIHHAGVDADPTPEQTALYHVNEHGWPGNGYHVSVMKDGSAYLTQRLTTMSYHVAGRNHECIGILLNGDFNEGRVPTEAQLITAQKVVDWIGSQLPGGWTVAAHNNVALPSSATNCCGDTWDDWVERIV
jgi:N-acetylmuramoyl-L-alanine amidase